MPELPEVETTLRGLKPHCIDQTIQHIQINQPKLRWPIPQQIHQLEQSVITSMQRRAKYLIMNTSQGSMIWHLGMSGSMRLLAETDPAAKHEHVKLIFDNGQSLRYRDPRRFGALLFTNENPLQHELLTRLGPEPLSDSFHADYLWQQCQKRRAAIKQVIMDGRVVVGVGNIYACESLFLSAINPKTPAFRISLIRVKKLVNAIKTILKKAIDRGGTTLQDFTQSDGKPGYFRQSLNVYANHAECPVCNKSIKRIVQGQRSTFYCSHCQR